MAGSQSLERGLEILELLDASSEPLGIREMARSLDISPTIVQRLVNTLSEYGYLQQNADMRKYVIGYRAFGLGWKLTADDRLIAASMDALQNLSSNHQLNSYLGVLRQERALYLLALQSEGPIAIRGVPGAKAYLHSTAMGKVLLAQLPEEQALAILKRAPLARPTRLTKTNPEDIMNELAEIRKSGVAYVNGENLPSVTSIGVPIWDHKNTVVASISVAYPNEYFPLEEEKNIEQILKETGQSISSALGYKSAHQ